MKYYNIPVFVPHYGCPFDCVFCNQKHITGVHSDVTGETAKKIIDETLKTLPKTDRRIEIAFFGGSFTAISIDLQIELLSVANSYIKSGEVDGIRLSTRPDFIDDEIMERLISYGVTAVELGVQSMDCEVLEKSERGHKKDSVYNAVKTIKKYPIELGLQMMTGLPGDTPEKSIATAKEIIALKPDTVRIYPTLVIRDTRLNLMYQSGEYVPQTLDNAVSLASKLIEMFRKNNITILRVGLAATDEISPGQALISGPYHPAFGELCESEILYNKMSDLLKSDTTATFAVNPADISKAVGNRKKNIRRFEKLAKKITLVQSENVEKNTIVRLEG